MTLSLDELVEEGRLLARPMRKLAPTKDGEVAAVWYDLDYDELDEDGHHLLITVDSRYAPGVPQSVTGLLNVFVDFEHYNAGRVEMSSSWPEKKGTKLQCSEEIKMLPPIDAIFRRGTKKIDKWLGENNWDRDSPHNGNFKDPIANRYENLYISQNPALCAEAEFIYAYLGGWNTPWPDDDWPELIDDFLLIHTIRDAEPYIEVWYTQQGQFRVIQRIT